MPQPDYYHTLELDSEATEEQIWLSYHKMQFLYSKGKLDGGVRKFLLVDEAYRILSNKQAKESYDRWYEALSHHQEEVRSMKRLFISFLSSFLAASIAATVLSSTGHMAMNGTVAYSVIFAILLAVMFAYRNKLKKYTL